jgi:hypothetical protein
MLTSVRPRTLATLMAVALAVRVPGLWWGLPGPTHLFSYHPDEFHSLRGVLSLSQGDLNPHFFNYGCLYLYLVDAACFILHPSLVLGVSAEALPAALRAWTLDARLVSLLAGVATVGVVAVGAEALCAGAGVWAGLALALTPLHALHARYATVDATLALWAAGALTTAVLAATRRKPSLYLVSGVLAGLATSTKYSGAVTLVIPVLAAVLDPSFGPARRLRLAAATLFTAAAAFALTSPFVFLAWAEASRHISFELHHMRVGESPAREADPWGWWFHLKWLTVGTAGLGPAGLVFVLVAACRRQAYLWRPAAAFALLAFAAISLAGVRYVRYEILLLPAAFVGAGACLAGLIRRRLKWLAVIWLGLGALHSGYIAVRLCRPDSRDLALRKLLSVSRPDEIVGLIWEPWFHSPPVDYCNGGQALRRNPTLRQWARPLRPLGVVGYDAARLRALRPRWFILSEVEQRDYIRTGQASELWEVLAAEYVPVAAWNDGPWGTLVPRSLAPPQDWLYPAMPLWLLARRDTSRAAEAGLRGPPAPAG